MGKLEAIRIKIRDDFDAALGEAFEAGREQGRKEGADAMRGIMMSVINGDTKPTLLGSLGDEPVGQEDGGAESEGIERAAPGSVKPAIEKMLRDAPSGLRPSEIASRGGFKHNTVRGTLWTLGKEGFAKSKNGRWYVIAESETENAPTETEDAFS